MTTHNNKQIEKALQELLEPLSAIEHERWSHWQRYMHGKGTKQSDGSLIIPADLVERWERQMGTAYADLSEREKDGDREQVQVYLPLIVASLSSKQD